MGKAGSLTPHGIIIGIGRWSASDPFTVLVFAPMIQPGSIAHIDVMPGSLSSLASQVFDPRLTWDAGRAGAIAEPVREAALYA